MPRRSSASAGTVAASLTDVASSTKMAGVSAPLTGFALWEVAMSNETTQHEERQLEAVANRLERLETTIATILDFLKFAGPDILAKFPGSSFDAHLDILPLLREWPKGPIFVFSPKQPSLEPVERAAPPGATWSAVAIRGDSNCTSKDGI